ncbi:TspO/MBR related protein [Isoptericola jiangsuensis]|uniref:TspO/MBR related protein n=1 Tax=Isoptericola jiangsuensis TaxID=548579 RepID=A0A2A9EZ23_9MICO|nr:tryptophan-rich sensory protein [Isoptericola jiangsuensis]PFG44118.1 TspO/MBR related protein [Isoptericola jiangsuensis]
MTAPTGTTTTTGPTAADRVRQAVVLVGALVAVAAAAVGSGAFGGQPIQDAAGGALSAEATVVAPGTPAFRIWSVIYLGLVVTAVVQALPGRAADPRWRATAWWVLASMALNALWIAVVQAGWLWGSVVVIAALLVVLGVLLVRYVRLPRTRTLDGVVAEATTGLYLGWVCVATLANVTAALSAAAVGDLGLGASAWGAVLVLAGAAIVVAVAVRAVRRPVVAVATGLAAGWGLAWIAVARTQGPLVDATVATAATVAAAVAALVPVALVVLARRRR